MKTWRKYRTYKRIQKLWQEYQEAAKEASSSGDVALVTSKLSTFLDTFQASYHEFKNSAVPAPPPPPIDALHGEYHSRRERIFNFAGDWKAKIILLCCRAMGCPSRASTGTAPRSLLTFLTLWTRMRSSLSLSLSLTTKWNTPVDSRCRPFMPTRALLSAGRVGRHQRSCTVYPPSLWRRPPSDLAEGRLSKRAKCLKLTACAGGHRHFEEGGKGDAKEGKGDTTPREKNWSNLQEMARNSMDLASSKMDDNTAKMLAEVIHKASTFPALHQAACDPSCGVPWTDSLMCAGAEGGGDDHPRGEV